MKNPTENQSRGFVVVATKRRQFLISAQNLCQSILDHYEDARITLFTEQRFIDDPEYQEYFRDFEHILPTPSDTNREKMYGMANSPYDQTFYIDADCEVVSEDIQNVFDHLDDGSDMVYVELTSVAKRHFAEYDWGPGELDHLTHCGGVCLYNSANPLVREFMSDWYTLHLQQRDHVWNPKEFEIHKVPKSFREWDQLTLWWLVHYSEKYKPLKWKFFPDNYRWNYFTSFGFNLDGTHNYDTVDPVVIHYSSWMDKTGEKGYLND